MSWLAGWSIERDLVVEIISGATRYPASEKDISTQTNVTKNRTLCYFYSHDDIPRYTSFRGTHPIRTAIQTFSNHCGSHSITSPFFPSSQAHTLLLCYPSRSAKKLASAIFLSPLCPHLAVIYFAVGRSGCIFLVSPCSRPRRAESVELGKSPTSSTSSSSKVVMRRDVHEPELAHPGEERGMSSNSTRAVTLRSAGKQVMRKLMMMMMITLVFGHTDEVLFFSFFRVGHWHFGFWCFIVSQTTPRALLTLSHQRVRCWAFLNWFGSPSVGVPPRLHK